MELGDLFLLLFVGAVVYTLWQLRNFREGLENVGYRLNLFWAVCTRLHHLPRRRRWAVEQLYRTGLGNLHVVLLVGLFIGMIVSLQTGIELAPIHMPNVEGHTYEFRDLGERTFLRLPPLLADSLPDRFGNALVNRWMAENGVEVAYVVPKEGALQWFDMLAIPADAPNPDAAHKFIDFIMDAQITADITNYVWYASANEASMPLIDAEIISDPGIFPTEEAKKNLWPAEVKSPRTDRTITRLWTEVKTGQ